MTKFTAIILNALSGSSFFEKKNHALLLPSPPNPVCNVHRDDLRRGPPALSPGGFARRRAGRPPPEGQPLFASSTLHIVEADVRSLGRQVGQVLSNSLAVYGAHYFHLVNGPGPGRPTGGRGGGAMPPAGRCGFCGTHCHKPMVCDGGYPPLVH